MTNICKWYIPLNGFLKDFQETNVSFNHTWVDKDQDIFYQLFEQKRPKVGKFRIMHCLRMRIHKTTFSLVNCLKIIDFF